MTKLIIQIPCYNEEQTLSLTLSQLPKKIDNISEIQTLVIDDGSNDNTLKVAQQCDVDHIVNLPKHSGLAAAFMAGIDHALAAGADIIVNTDADNQYNADDISKLLAPLLNGTADIVVGSRPIEEIKHFSPAKKALQRLGSWVVRWASGTNVPDAPSGFRAISREAGLRLNVFNNHTYTLETLIQAGHKGISVSSVPIRVNDNLRPSRLITSNTSYILRSITTIVRIFMLYSPLRFFALLGSIPIFLGLLLSIRWVVNVFVFAEPGRTYIPSLILVAILLLAGVQIWVLGLIADLMAANRSLLEEIRLRMRRIELVKREKIIAETMENLEE